MNVRLVKEVRDLLPFLGMALLCLVAPYFVWRDQAYVIGAFALALGCAGMGGYSLGQEFHYRTLGLLLSQPISRRVIWGEKMLVLGAGVTVLLVAQLACLVVFKPAAIGAGSLLSSLSAAEAFLPVLLIPLCAFCAAPYLTLLLGSGLSAVACTIIFPIAILAVSGLTAPRLFESLGPFLLLVYCAACCYLGYRRFMNLQVSDSPARELSVPVWMENWLELLTSKLASPLPALWGSLLKKELRVQQATLLAAMLFGVAALSGASLARNHPESARDILVVECTIYMVLIPLLAGAVGVVEERRWGTVTWQLSLPPSISQQWAVKLLVVLAVSLVLGMPVPIALRWAGHKMLGFFMENPTVSPWQAIGLWALAELSLTSVAIYAGSLCRNPLKAVLAALAILLAPIAAAWWTTRFVQGFESSGLVVIDLTSPADVSPIPSWVYELGVGLVLLSCLMQWFAFMNYRRGTLDWRGVRRQLLSLIVIVVLLAGSVTAASLLSEVVTWQAG